MTSLGEQFAGAGDQLQAERAERDALQRPTDQLDPAALRVFDALPRTGTRSVPELSAFAGLSPELVSQRLIQLSLLGLAMAEGGRWRLVPEHQPP